MARICSLTGDREQAEAISSKIVSLSSIASRPEKQNIQEPELPAFLLDDPETGFSEDAEISFADTPEVAGTDAVSVPFEAEVDAAADDSIEYGVISFPAEPEESLDYGEVSFPDEAEESASTVKPAEPLSDPSDYEIEIDLDMDEEPVQSQVTGNENWFDTVTDIFENIATEPGKVKFGEGMEQGDAQSHYDLGMAFREMGLFDEAINEFRNASSDPQRKVECLVQQAGCFRDKGELELAENALTALFGAPGLFHEERTAIKYELALTYEAGGRSADASRLYSEIEAESPAFRDVKARLEQSSLGSGESVFDFSEDELLDFDLK